MTELELFAVCVTMMKSGQRTILMRDDTIVAVDAELIRLRGEVERLTKERSEPDPESESESPIEWSEAQESEAQETIHELSLIAQLNHIQKDLLAERKAIAEAVRGELGEDCPVCPNVGFYTSYKNGDPVQAQCEWCETTKGSAFRINDLANRIEKGEVKK